MSEGETKFNPNNPNNFNVEAQLLLIPGFLIVIFVGKYTELSLYFLRKASYMASRMCG